MFAGIATAEVNPRRKWTAVVSFTLQAALAAVVLVIPLLRPIDLPEAFAHRRLFVPVADAVVRTFPSGQQPAGGAHSNSPVALQPIVVRPDHGVHYGRPVDVGSYQRPSDVQPGLDRYAVTGPPLGDIPIPSVRPVLKAQPRVSAIMQGNLIHRVEPIYPVIAKNAGVRGTVVINAVISRDGRIEQAQVISGSPLLYPAALDAVRQWRYRPYYLDGDPVEVETQITVNFFLNR